MTLTIGVDVGGTKVAAGLVDPDGHMIAETKRATPASDADAAAAAIADVIEELRAGHVVEAVGIGAAGFVGSDRATMLFAANLPGWRNESLRDEISGRVGLPVVVENDANAAAWAEYRFGAGRGESHLVCVTVGTGIGGGIVIDGRLYRGRFGIGAEVGHFRVEPNGRPCGCGQRGCWEQYASGNALVREARARAREDPDEARILLHLSDDGAPETIMGPHVTRAAREGDPVAVASFEAVGRWLGQGLADIAEVIDPGCFIIGGGVVAAGELLLGPARVQYEKALSGRQYRPLATVRAAALGPEAGIVGAADLARYR